MGHDPGHQRPFFASNWETEQKQSKNKNNPFFATCLAFCPVFEYKNTKSVQKSSQVAEKQRKKNLFFFCPTPGQRHRCDGPTPGRTPGYARALVARGPGHPGQRPAKCGPTPGYRGDARGLPDLPPSWGRWASHSRVQAQPRNRVIRAIFNLAVTLPAALLVGFLFVGGDASW